MGVDYLIFQTTIFNARSGASPTTVQASIPSLLHSPGMEEKIIFMNIKWLLAVAGINHFCFHKRLEYKVSFEVDIGSLS